MKKSCILFLSMTISKSKINGNKVVLTFEGSRGNSFGVDMLEELLAQLNQIEEDESISGVILTGSGRTFSVGGDVFAMHEALEQGDASIYLKPVIPLIEKIIVKILEFPKPVIAAVNGSAAGAGLSLALACDEIFTIEKAKFGMAFGGLALSPDSGSSVLFTHHFGRKTTIKGVATAQVFNANYVVENGIAQLSEPVNLIDNAATYIEECIAVSPHSYAKTKYLVNQAILKQLEHNLPLEFEYIVESASRDIFKDKVQEIIDKLSN